MVVANGTFSSLADALKELKQSKDLTKVDLTNVDVRDAGLSDLLFGLRKQPVLKELILANCGLGIPSARHLTTFLKYNKTVTRLYLQHNQRLGDEGVEELTVALQSNQTLEVLNLANCNVGDVGAAALAENPGSIQKLYLYNNRIQSIGSSALADMILHQKNAALLELFVWDNPLTQAGLDCLRDAHKQRLKDAAETKGSSRLNLVVGLKNEKLAKKAAPAVKRNFVVPKDKENAAAVDTSKPGLFGDLRAKAQSLAGETEDDTTSFKAASPYHATKKSVLSNTSIRTSPIPVVKSYHHSVGGPGNTTPNSAKTKTTGSSLSSYPKLQQPTSPIASHTKDQAVVAQQEEEESSSSYEEVEEHEEIDPAAADIAQIEAEIAALQKQIQSVSD